MAGKKKNVKKSNKKLEMMGDAEESMAAFKGKKSKKKKKKS